MNRLWSGPLAFGVALLVGIPSSAAASVVEPSSSQDEALASGEFGGAPMSSDRKSDSGWIAPTGEIETSDFENINYLALPVHGQDKVVFSLPSSCSSDPSGSGLSCQSGEVASKVLVVTSAGEVIEHDELVTDSSIVVEPADTPEDAEALVFVAPIEDAELLEVAADAFLEMVAPGNFLSQSELDAQELSLTGVAPRTAAASKASARPAKVTIPSGYRYCPSSCSPKSLHDYCSYSPDQPTIDYSGPTPGVSSGKVDFRGPCARHDMTIDLIRKRSIPLATKRSQRAFADSTFKTHMRQNCAYTFYGSKRGGLSSCYARAGTYYAVVSQRTKTWNGK